MTPSEPYERSGDVPNTVFPCGIVLNGDELRLYYGSADTTISLAIASLQEILDAVLEGDVTSTDVVTA
jgi:predicted GH43/DUF377 family glycosyl hydrolase